jgi:DNA adenine methylase
MTIRIVPKMKPLTLQPIPYQGSKRSLAPRICSLFGTGVDTLYEPFAGSAAVAIYAAHHELARRFVIGDSYPPLIALLDLIINHPEKVAREYREIWEDQHKVGPEHFNIVRAQFNASRNPVALLYLIARCVKNAVRFNRHGAFTQSPDKRRTGMNPAKLGASVREVSALFKGRTELFVGDFVDCTAAAAPSDLIYMDPPYQGTTYGRDKRYAAGLERERLIAALSNLDARNVPYILSYDGQSGERTYGKPLPKSLNATRMLLHAGRSSQATLSGVNADTIESLYVSNLINTCGSDLYFPKNSQPSLFAA